MRKLFYLLLIFCLISCVEENENNFQEDTIVEAYLIVGEPINNFRVMKTLPILDTFKLENATITNADVLIYSEKGDSIKLKYNKENLLYQAEKQNYLVKEKTLYYLQLIYNNDTIKGKTYTPKTFNWIQKLPDTIQYPKDSIKLDDIVKLSWENPGSFNFYHITVKCLDTLNYGKYLNPPTDELNRRISLFKNATHFFDNTTNHGVAPSNDGAFLWTSVKWYGMQEIVIYNPDYNWFRWVGQYYQSEYSELLSSVEGKHAIGVFGSATAIRDTFFLVKNIK